MAMAVQQIHHIAHLPLVLGVLRRLEVATIIDRLIPPHPAHVLSCGRGVEALVLAILDGAHALYKVGKRLEERGMVALLQPGLTRASLHDYRLGHILDALFAANLNKVFSAIALKALEVYAIPTPWLYADRLRARVVLAGIAAPAGRAGRKPAPACPCRRGRRRQRPARPGRRAPVPPRGRRAVPRRRAGRSPGAARRG